MLLYYALAIIIDRVAASLALATAKVSWAPALLATLDIQQLNPEDMCMMLRHYCLFLLYQMTPSDGKNEVSVGRIIRPYL